MDTHLPGGGRAGAATAVLVVHGGPWARDGWGLDPVAQWLANRGYACVHVNFGGSCGRQRLSQRGQPRVGCQGAGRSARCHDHLAQQGTSIAPAGPRRPRRYAALSVRPSPPTGAKARSRGRPSTIPLIDSPDTATRSDGFSGGGGTSMRAPAQSRRSDRLSRVAVVVQRDRLRGCRRGTVIRHQCDFNGQLPRSNRLRLLHWADRFLANTWRPRE